MTDWQARDALQLYNIPQWGEGYVDVDESGRLLVRPCRDARCIDLQEVIQTLPSAGLRLPVLLRFVDILQDRVKSLCEAFEAAIAEQDYAADYSVIYPIKVNQQADVIEQIAAQRPGQVGLEAGSKPELLAVLGLAAEGSVVICNGYKDREYIRLAGIGARMGHDLNLVVEKLSELQTILEECPDNATAPGIGLRVRLTAIAAGNWQNTGGDKSKFGLSSAQVLEAVAYLRERDALERLTLLHLHLGSQVANIDDIRRGIIEAARVYCDLRELGVPLSVMDVGGGLGVDYEGTASRSFCSMNYSQAEYAATIVSAVQQVCAQRQQPVPALLSESGRALTAHHAVLVSQVVDAEIMDSRHPGDCPGPMSPLLQQLSSLLGGADGPLLERYQRASNALQAVSEAYSGGELSLAQRAWAEQAWRAICADIRNRLDARRRDQRQLLDELEERLADKYFVNLSVFQSLPDVWALDQVFPILPLHGLNEQPSRRVALCDLTCDSDGRIDRYVDEGGVESSLPLHPLRKDQPYHLGFFMVGAYQEILGDMHNLFGDTDAVSVVLTEDGWRFGVPEHGDRGEDLLRYVHLDPKRLRAAWSNKLDHAGLSEDERAAAMQTLGAGLAGYTYLTP